MISLMLLAALWLPPNPAAEHTALSAIFEGGVRTRLSIETPEQFGLVQDWHGSGCQSRFAVRISARKTLHPDIDWRFSDREANEITLHGSRVVIAGGISDATDINWLEFRFTTIAKAREATLAFQRLRAACRPQR